VHYSKIGRSISEEGQSRHFDGLPMTSGLPPEADIVTAGPHVSKVPTVDIAACPNNVGYYPRRKAH